MLNIEVVWMDAQGQVQERSLQLPAGACLQDAITACGLEVSGAASSRWNMRCRRATASSCISH